MLTKHNILAQCWLKISWHQENPYLPSWISNGWPCVSPCRHRIPKHYLNLNFADYVTYIGIYHWCPRVYIFITNQYCSKYSWVNKYELYHPRLSILVILASCLGMYLKQYKQMYFFKSIPRREANITDILSLGWYN